MYFYVLDDAREAARRAGPFATVDSCCRRSETVQCVAGHVVVCGRSSSI